MRNSTMVMNGKMFLVYLALEYLVCDEHVSHQEELR